MDSRRASCCNGLGTGFVSFWELEPGGNAFGAQLGPLYLCGAVCPPALAARAYFLDTAAVRQVARSAVGPRRPYQLPQVWFHFSFCNSRVLQRRTASIPTER